VSDKKLNLLVVLRLKKVELFFDSFTVFCDGEFEGLRLLRRSLKKQREERRKGKIN
jgi:hypothetical protein